MGYRKILKDADGLEILVVEDSPTQALQLSNLLEEAGYHVSAPVNGAEALRQISDSPPALVISDIIMPEMDGYELCGRIKKQPEAKFSHSICPKCVEELYPELHK